MTSTRTLQMRRLHPSFGVELAGLELHLPLDDGTWAHIWEAFNEHSLLVFHDQPLTDEEQMRFSQRFGPLETTVKTLGKEDRLHPNLVELANVDEDGKLMDWTDRRMLYQSGNQMWHTRLVLQAGAGPGLPPLRPPGSARGRRDGVRLLPRRLGGARARDAEPARRQGRHPFLRLLARVARPDAARP